MVKMADQVSKRAEEEILMQNKENGKSFTCAFFKGFAKSTVTNILQSFEDRKTTKIKAGSRKCLVKSPEGGQLQEAWFKTQLHVLQLLVTRRTEVFEEEATTFHKRKKVNAASPALEKR